MGLLGAIGTVAGAALGGPAGGMIGGSLGGLLDGGNSKGTTSTTGQSGPWGPMQGYLVGGVQKKSLRPGVQPIYDSEGKLSNPESDFLTGYQPGLANMAADLYGTTGMSQTQKDMLGNQSSAMKYVLDNHLYDQLGAQGMSAIGGGFDTAITPAQQVNLQSARAAQGDLDPTSSMRRLLSGNVDTSALDPVINNATQRMTQNFNEQVMPGINQGAMMAGQYGGSRQGVAQGIASRGLAQSIGDMQAGMYNNAFNTAQSNMYGTANALNNQAGQNAQFNSNLQLQNNAQQMQQAQQNLNNRVAGGNMLNGAVNGVNNAYNAANSAFDTSRNAPWSDLKNYQNVIQPISGLGNTAVQNTPYYQNQLGNIMGMSIAGSNLLKNLGFGSNNAGTASNNWSGQLPAGQNAPDGYDWGSMGSANRY